MKRNTKHAFFESIYNLGGRMFEYYKENENNENNFFTTNARLVILRLPAVGTTQHGSIS